MVTSNGYNRHQDLAGFIVKKMLKILNEKEKEASSKRKKTSLSLFAIRCLVDLGANAEEIHGDPVRSPSLEATQSPPYA